jgi:hypothetical protein
LRDKSNFIFIGFGFPSHCLYELIKLEWNVGRRVNVFPKVLNFVLRISDICNQGGYQEFIDTSFSQCNLKFGFIISVVRVPRCLLPVGGIHLSHSGWLKVMVNRIGTDGILRRPKFRGDRFPILVVRLLHTRSVTNRFDRDSTK